MLGRKTSQMAAKGNAICFYIAMFCNYAGFRCSKPAKFSVEMQSYEGRGEYGPLRKIGVCEECWLKMQEKLPSFGAD
jgi:hypothetical protein